MIWKCDADERKDDQEEDPNQMDRPNQKGYRNEGKIGKKYKKTGSGRIEMADIRPIPLETT